MVNRPSLILISQKYSCLYQGPYVKNQRRRCFDVSRYSEDLTKCEFSLEPELDFGSYYQNILVSSNTLYNGSTYTSFIK